MTLEGGAFAAGDAAAGLAALRKGFGRTPEDDRLFALGYPHVVTLTDGPLPSRLPPLEPGPCSRVLAIRFARRGAKDDTLDASDAPLAGKELAKAVATAVEFDGPRLFFLEAVTSSEQVAELAVEHVAKLQAKAWKSHPFEAYGDDSMRALYFVLLRCPAKVRAALCKKLESTFTAIAKTMKDGYWRPLQGLDLCLHGAKGVKRSGYRPDDKVLALGDLIYADDDPKFVAAETKRELATMKPNDSAVFDARIAFLGGPATVKLLCESMTRFNSQHHRAMVEQLGRVKHPAVAKMMEDALDRPKAKAAAKKWLDANG